MTQEETKAVLREMRIAYPSRYRDMTAEEGRRLMQQWRDAFPESLDEVMDAVKSAIAESKFHPTIGEIRDKMRNTVHVDGPTPEEWESMKRFRRKVGNSIIRWKNVDGRILPVFGG